MIKGTRTATLVNAKISMPQIYQPRRLSFVASGAPSDLAPNRTTNLLADILVRQRALDPGDMVKALALQRHQDLQIGQICLAHGMISEADLLFALATQYHTAQIDLTTDPADPCLAHLLTAEVAARLSAVVWRRAGAALVVATHRPDLLPAIRAALRGHGTVLITIASCADVQNSITDLYGSALARAAEARSPEQRSCRRLRTDRTLVWALVLTTLGLIALGLAPQVTLVTLSVMALAVLYLNSGLKLVTVVAAHRAVADPSPDTPRAPSSAPKPLHRNPVVTILLPLFEEKEIAQQLVDRIAKIDYPKELLDVLLIVETNDTTTRSALSKVDLPPWMRAIVVPTGNPQTKPRAMNYALNFARGSLVTIYDAEDAPEPDQIQKVVKQFANSPAETVCLQGQLDFYNSRHNWLSRCFTVEYATWFRLMLPGTAALGLVVPLGGTTLFFKRDALEELGAWDTHNVTEDADLGVRLARAGYRTDMIQVTTFEEANSAVWPWIRQRSRWLKGYALTWASHMRQPTALLRDLGPWRFIGLQIQLLGAVLGFLLAPVIWSIAIKAFGLWHPLDALLGMMGYWLLGATFVACHAVSITAMILATEAPHLKPLRGYILTMEPYFALGCVAALLGLWEVVHRPFHWAKTSHGAYGGSDPAVLLSLPNGDQNAAASTFNLTSNAVDK
ncbi:MAG: cellulose synthase/poly-beta-1,6-N-acetylglucosamine synthase-like glycosyltransferase [Paracoccaceae bacterium]